MREKEFISIIPEEPYFRKKLNNLITMSSSLAINKAFNFHSSIHYWLTLIQIDHKPKLLNFLYDQTINSITDLVTEDAVCISKWILLTTWSHTPC
jgi:hypothetical protein